MKKLRQTIALLLSVALFIAYSFIRFQGLTTIAQTVVPPWDPFFSTPLVVANLAPIVPSTSSNRTYGIAAGDFDGDTRPDVVVGRTDGRVFFLKGNGDGTFQAPSLYTWKLETFNAWAFAAGDMNDDGLLDVVWGANASGADTGGVVRVNDGDLRYLAGNGDGTFATTNNYIRSGITFNAGTLIADVGTDTGSVAVGQLNGDSRPDLVVGTLDTPTTTSVRILLNNGAGVFAAPTNLISQTISCTTPCSPIYFPATSTQNSPWGLAIADADANGTKDLLITDRALYTYLYRNDGAASFTLQGSNNVISGRPNVYLGHDSYRDAVGFTASTAAGDVNGDGKADFVLGINSGTNTPTTGCGSPSGPCAHDGNVLLDVSRGETHSAFGLLSDVGTAARGITLIDVNGDGYRDIVTGNYEGQVVVMRQLPPIDSDGDGISDYVDNAPYTSNAPRIDLNTDGSTNSRDQLDNDFDTLLGNPEDPSTWQRLGDPEDVDDDNDFVRDNIDNCPLVWNSDQADRDGDGVGDVCDPLDNRDVDGDGVPNGPGPGDPLYAASLAARAKWSTGTTHFVIRIDALGRFFQNEFTQIMTDAGTLSPSAWATKCWENYQNDDIINGAPYEPCGTDEGTPAQVLTLPGGKEVPITLVVIPKQLWTDPPVINWINDRNDSVLFELAQHGTYHFDNTPLGDWRDLQDRNFYSCEMCGLSESEVFELLKVGQDTLLGNYSNKWVAESGATMASPKIDWTTSAYPLITFSPPYNTSDTIARKAIAQLGYRGFSASVYEEGEAGSYGYIFTPEGSHHERFDQFGMYHASADVQLSPPNTNGDTYNTSEFEQYLQSQTNAGGLTTWLIEEVDWSGRPCNNVDRLGTCNGEPNRENNTVYLPRWNAWLQALDFVRNYPGGVAMTMGEVALAKGFDNAPTVPNPDQADNDHNGIGDVIDGATLVANTAELSRNRPGTLSALLTNGTGNAIAGQTVVFAFDADHNGTPENYLGTTDIGGLARVSVTTTQPVGASTFSVSWNGIHVQAAALGNVTIFDASNLTLDGTNPTSGQVTDAVLVAATLTDSDNAAIAGETLNFRIGSATATGVTDVGGRATATLNLNGPAAASSVVVEFAGNGSYGASNASSSFTIEKEDTVFLFPDAVATKTNRATATATLTEADGAPLENKLIEFYAEEKLKSQLTWTLFGTARTDVTGSASIVVPPKYVKYSSTQIQVRFVSDNNFLSSQANAFTYRP